MANYDKENSFQFNYLHISLLHLYDLAHFSQERIKKSCKAFEKCIHEQKHCNLIYNNTFDKSIFKRYSMVCYLKNLGLISATGTLKEASRAKKGEKTGPQKMRMIQNY